MLQVRAARSLGDFRLDVAFEAPTAGIVALFGKSGAGKTTLVSMLAGLLKPARGRISLGDTVLFDSAAGIDLPPERRRVGYVFQDGLLFPHLNVRANLLYGFRRAPADDRFIRLDKVVELLGLAPLLGRRPAGLSGGEKQRVAIGRALLANPRLLLMDEPLSSLDASRKEEILPFIEQLRDELRLPIVYVSHDMSEIVRLADTLVLVSEGRVAAVGPVDEVFGRLDLRPLTGRYEAGAILQAEVAGHDEASGLTQLIFPGGSLWVARLGLPPATRLRLRLRARDVALALAPPRDTSILNILAGTITEIGGDEGPQVDVKLALGAPPGVMAIWARVTARSARDLDLRVGRRAYALIKAVAIDRHSLGRYGR